MQCNYERSRHRQTGMEVRPIPESEICPCDCKLLVRLLEEERRLESIRRLANLVSKEPETLPPIDQLGVKLLGPNKRFVTKSGDEVFAYRRSSEGRYEFFAHESSMAEATIDEES